MTSGDARPVLLSLQSQLEEGTDVVVIFGFGAGAPEDKGETAPTTCPNCHNAVFLHHVRSEKKFSLYFVPLVPYGSNEYLLCPICHKGIALRPEQLASVNGMKSNTQAYRRGTFHGDYAATVDVFWRHLGHPKLARQIQVAPAAPMPAPVAPRPLPLLPPPSGPPGAASARPSADRLEALARLHAAGSLTDDEFAEMKRRVLGL